MNDDKGANILAKHRSTKLDILKEIHIINSQLEAMLEAVEDMSLSREKIIDDVRERVDRCDDSLDAIDRLLVAMRRLLNDALSIGEDTTK